MQRVYRLNQNLNGNKQNQAVQVPPTRTIFQHAGYHAMLLEVQCWRSLPEGLKFLASAAVKGFPPTCNHTGAVVQNTVRTTRDSS